MKAIDTHYAGCLFRSRLEARWAVFFDALGEPWEYEKEGFELPSGRYLPDFWLPRLDCWLEIKGEEPTEHEKKLCEELAVATEKPVAISWGLPYSFDEDFDPDFEKCKMTVYSGCISWEGETGGTCWDRWCYWALDWDYKLCICDGPLEDGWQPLCPGSGKKFEAMKNRFQVSGPLWEKHVNAAKSARFEFGQTPAIRR